MKKLIFTITVLFGALAFLLSSCSSDSDDVVTLSGKYTLSMDAQTVASGETEEVGMLGNAISLSLGDNFSVIVSGVPESSGEVIQIDDESEASVIISGINLLGDGADEIYFSITGTVTRNSGSKITFEGTCSEFGATTTHSFSGTAESDAFKII